MNNWETADSDACEIAMLLDKSNLNSRWWHLVFVTEVIFLYLLKEP